ncbi:hypothetical protein HanIR_Chr09g0405541 [Helianthus annuus]|nr:hypothetical protein HanIR_Chr09g0405541 [Helianthus annuus]
MWVKIINVSVQSLKESLLIFLGSSESFGLNSYNSKPSIPLPLNKIYI